MENVLNHLNSSINEGNDQDIIKNLRVLIEQAENVQIKDGNIFKKLLQSESQKIQILSTETIAELCKNPDNRTVFTNEDIINRLVNFMDSDCSELIFTTVRALGNICYENPEASNIVEKNGIDSILTTLKDDSNRDNNSLTTKVSGLLVNLLSTHDTLPKIALKGGILPVVENLLNKYKDSIEDNKLLLIFLLSIVNSCTEYLDDKDYMFTESMAKVVVDVFKKSEMPEICVLCLEIFSPLPDKEEIKTLLAKEGICELLYDLIEKYRDKVQDEDSRIVLKMACDLIVLILTGDAYMDFLYNNGKGQTYLNMLTWLDSNDMDLLSTSILAIGNFARKDTNCIQMVKNGVAKKLIDILERYNRSIDINDCKIQHALLSTLKNLVIPKENKPQALKDNIIEVMYPMLGQDRYMVIFKLLGTYRMVIDGQPQAALDLLSRKDFIERLVYWCYNSDHLGVRGEIPRIFSWLIKSCNSSEPFSMFVSVKDSVKCIVDMLLSNHGVMQNESFLALTILDVGLSKKENQPQTDLDIFYQSICDASIGKNLSFIINKYGEKWDKHTIENCLSLFEQLIKSEKVLKDLKDNDIYQSLEKLESNPNVKENLQRLNQLSQGFVK